MFTSRISPNELDGEENKLLSLLRNLEEQLRCIREILDLAASASNEGPTRRRLINMSGEVTLLVEYLNGLVEDSDPDDLEGLIYYAHDLFVNSEDPSRGLSLRWMAAVSGVNVPCADALQIFKRIVQLGKRRYGEHMLTPEKFAERHDLDRPTQRSAVIEDSFISGLTEVEREYGRTTVESALPVDSIASSRRFKPRT